MKEIAGNIWEKQGPNSWIGITTNGFVKPTSGECTMGKGIALEAKLKFPELPRRVGDHIKERGNVVWLFPEFRVFTFPTKSVWWQKSTPELIDQSCSELKYFLEAYPKETFYLPRPGCGSGGLVWDIVKPILDKYFDKAENLFIIDKEVN